MYFRGHLISGIAAGVAVAEAASQFGHIDRADHRSWAWICGTAVFFSLFPDLDTSSVPQRWFFRIVFAALLYLGWTERYQLAMLVALVSILPLLDHHRGWTHWKLSPLVVPALLGAMYEYWQVRNTWSGVFSWIQVLYLLETHLVFLLACMAGWYTHLAMDGRFKLFPTDSDHH